MRGVRRDAAGFTIPELLVAIALETIIFGALATAFIVVLNGGDSVNENLNKSSDARFAANYIISDARNSSGPEISLTDATSCPDPTPPVAGAQTAVARFNWNSPNAAGTTTANITAYVLASGSLMRRHCEGGMLVSDGVLASSVATVSVTCAPISDCTGNPTSITVTITETPDKAGGPAFSFTLTAAFRKLVGGGSALTPSPPQSLIVFGSGGCGVSVTGSAFMRVYGNAFINTVDNGACHALSLGGSGVWNAGTTSILTGGSCVAVSGIVCPTVTPYSPALTDPYGGLVAPSAAGQPSQTGCTGPQASQTAQPGVYAGVFAVNGGNTCTLASGIYILRAGFNIGSGAIIKTGAGGVLFYLSGGAFVVAGGASLTLTAMTTGPFAGIAVWQAAADTSTISFSNGGALTFNGVIYAPKAQLNISGNAQTPVATAIAVQTVVMTNSGGISIGASAVPLSVTAPASLQPWTVSRPYPSTTVTPAGGDGSYAWSATGFPNGMSINASTGVISGTPTVAGTTSVVVTLNDALGDDPDTQTYSLTINAALVISTVSPLPSGEKTALYSTTLARTGGTAPFLWSQSGLPAGMTLDGSTGIISGTPTATGAPTVTVTLADAAGASVSKGLAITIAAQPTISSVTLTNVATGGTAGRVDKGDTIAIVFSAQMDVSSMCSTWATDTSNQSLVANNDVTVTLNDGGAANDSITVTSATCTFNFGSLNLGATTYVGTASAVFKGTGASKSTITWTVATRTLLITLGVKAAAGTVATVTTSTPIYTAGAMLDSAGASLGNSPFTLAAGKNF
jgi:type II secretory pathway pseudopilin PulG